jgi:WD40 repeat protein
VLRGHENAVTGVTFLPDGRLASSGGRTVRLWQLEWRQLVRSLRASTTACLTAAQRIAHLDEAPPRARAGWEACERRHGRTP